MSREQPSTADVRPIEDVILDLQKLLIGKLPTTNKMTLAAWGTFVEAANIHRFALLVIEDRENPRFPDKEFGEKYAADRILRKLADNLGVPNMKYEEDEKE